jgi:hypothetical protein
MKLLPSASFQAIAPKSRHDIQLYTQIDTAIFAEVSSLKIIA